MAQFADKLPFREAWEDLRAFSAWVVGGSLSGLMVFKCLKDLLFPCLRFPTSVSITKRTGVRQKSVHFLKSSEDITIFCPKQDF